MAELPETYNVQQLTMYFLNSLPKVGSKLLFEDKHHEYVDEIREHKKVITLHRIFPEAVRRAEYIIISTGERITLSDRTNCTTSKVPKVMKRLSELEEGLKK